jgi:hypothetical protein
MNRKRCDHRAAYAERNSKDRLIALERVKTLLRPRLVNMKCMVEVLSKSDDGFLEFNVGELAIQFTRGFGVWSERRDVIQMTVELQKEGDEEEDREVVGYEYTLDELARAGKQRRMVVMRKMEIDTAKAK